MWLNPCHNSVLHMSCSLIWKFWCGAEQVIHTDLSWLKVCASCSCAKISVAVFSVFTQRQSFIRRPALKETGKMDGGGGGTSRCGHGVTESSYLDVLQQLLFSAADALQLLTLPWTQVIGYWGRKHTQCSDASEQTFSRPSQQNDCAHTRTKCN